MTLILIEGLINSISLRKLIIMGGFGVNSLKLKTRLKLNKISSPLIISSGEFLINKSGVIPQLSLISVKLL